MAIMEGKEISKKIIDSLKNYKFEDLKSLLEINSYEGTRMCILSAMQTYYPEEFKKFVKGGGLDEKNNTVRKMR